MWYSCRRSGWWFYNCKHSCLPVRLKWPVYIFQDIIEMFFFTPRWFRCYTTMGQIRYGSTLCWTQLPSWAASGRLSLRTKCSMSIPSPHLRACVTGPALRPNLCVRKREDVRRVESAFKTVFSPFHCFLSVHSPNKTEFIKAKYQMLAFVHRMPCRDDDSFTAKDLSKVGRRAVPLFSCNFSPFKYKLSGSQAWNLTWK